ncbi:MAG: hypothetical protein ABID63_05520 [Pseudomonadota bacterium]
MTIINSAYGVNSATSGNAAYAKGAVTNATYPDFSKEMYSDPAMRPYLEQYYEKAYAPVRERIAAMRENGYTSKTVQTENGGTAQEISADQYEAAIPDFDSWLESQKTWVPRLRESTETALETAQRNLENQQKNHPDTQSDVRVVFSSGDQILGYLYKNGGMAMHDSGSYLRTFSDQAEKLGLTGQARQDYIVDAVSKRFSNVEIHRYSDQDAPTRREFSERWYPGNNVDQSYQSSLEEARANLAQRQELYRRQQNNIREMQSYLLGLMEQDQL